MRKLLKRREGFTLIELMIVILIIAILVAIAVPVYLNSRANAQKRTCQANQRTVDGAVQSYQANDVSQRYPRQVDMTTAGVAVLKQWPTCPTGNTTFVEYNPTTSAPPFLTCPRHPSQD